MWSVSEMVMPEYHSTVGLSQLRETVGKLPAVFILLGASIRPFVLQSAQAYLFAVELPGKAMNTWPKRPP